MSLMLKLHRELKRIALGLCVLLSSVILSACSPLDAVMVLMPGAISNSIPQVEGNPNDYPNRVLQYVGFSPNGYTLAVGYEKFGDSVVELWDVRQLPQSPQESPPSATPIVLPGHTDSIEGVVDFSPNGRLLAIGGKDGVVRIWDTADLKANPQELRGNKDSIFSLDFSPDGKMIAINPGYSDVRVWQLSQPDTPFVTLAGMPFTNEIAFTPDGQHVIVSPPSPESLIVRSIVEPDKPPLHMSNAAGLRSKLAFSPDGKLVAGGTVIWHTDNLEAPPIILDKLDASLASWEAFSSDGRMLAEARPTNGDVRLWDISTLADPAKIPSPVVLRHPAAYAVSFSSDGKTLASGGMYGSVRLWDYHNPTTPPVILNPSAMEAIP
jgi:WD40 repeat protein